jgi:hypothetical protein
MANGPGWTILRGSWPTSRMEVTSSRSREGRRNCHEAHLDRPLRHSVESHREVGVLLDLILRPDQPDPGDPESGQVATNHYGARRAG